LVTQRNVLGDEIGSVLEDGDDDGEKQWELEEHLADGSPDPNGPKSEQLRRCSR
jgi:hypothetical protein